MINDQMLAEYVLDGGSDVLKGGIVVVEEVVKWNGGVDKTRALGARGDTLVPLDWIVWLIVGGGIVRARVVSRVVFRGCEVLMEWVWMGEDSFDERSMKSVLGEEDSDDSELEGVGVRRRGLFPFGMILKTFFSERGNIT
ncbi:hypothetical protein Tco_1409736 [Tanacetum coccineum]